MLLTLLLCTYYTQTFCSTYHIFPIKYSHMGFSLNGVIDSLLAFVYSHINQKRVFRKSCSSLYGRVLPLQNCLIVLAVLPYSRKFILMPNWMSVVSKINKALRYHICLILSSYPYEPNLFLIEITRPVFQ